MNKIENILAKKWEKVTLEERQYLRDIGVLNGFGGAGQSWIARKLIGCIVWDFSIAIPDMHDFWYAQGGDKARRKECDEKFYQAMLQDIFDMYMEDRITKTQQVLKSVIALLAWCAIRLFGWKYFAYKEKSI